MPTSDGTPLPPTVAPRPRVLVVEDEPAVRQVARLMLELAGYAVVEATTAGEALGRVQSAEHRFVVVLLDVTLPDRSGLDLIPELRAAAPRSSVLLTSGRPIDNVAATGADAYISKPFTRDELVSAVRAVTAATPR